MKTCVSINCPFSKHCKDYNFLVDRESGCKTQKKFIEAATKLNRVETPLGLICATPCSDKDNPGLWIELYRPGEDAGMSLALVEYYGEDKEIVTRVWGNAQSEDYTDKITHKHVDEYFSGGIVRQDNLMVCDISRFAEYLSDGIYQSNSEWHFQDCDFTIIDRDTDLTDLSRVRKVDACGWYGIKALNPGFESGALVLMSDYYGGGCAALAQLFDDGDEWMLKIEKAIVETLSVQETVTSGTLLLIEIHGAEKSDEDIRLEELWKKFGDIPMDPETECIEEDFLHFPAGTERMEIWHWFDEHHSVGVAYLAGQEGK